MNDKDMKEFDKWHDENIANPPTLNELINKAWKGSCEYKQKEIDEFKNQIEFAEKIIKYLQVDKYNLINENAKLREQDQIISQEIKICIQIAEKLQAENAELKHKLSTIWKEAEKFYLDD